MNQFSVSVIINSLGKGGAEKLVSIIYPKFSSTKLKTRLLVLSDYENFEQYINRVKDSPHVEILPNKTLYSIRTIAQVKKFVQNSKVVHAHLFPTIFYVILCKKLFSRRTVIIYTEHGIVNKQNTFLRKLVIRWIYSNCDTIISLTDKMKKVILEYTSNLNKVVTIENGVDILSIEKTPKYDRNQLSEMLNIYGDDKKFILMTARFEKQKDHFGLINAMPNLNQNVILLLAGEGELINQCVELVKKLSLEHRVKFLGFRSDAVSLMKSVDLNILNTHFEGLSGVVLEGLASGVPFLGSEVAGVMEVLPNDMFTYKHNNLTDMVNKITNVLNDVNLKENMVSIALEHVKQFSIEKMYQMHVDLYKSKFKD